MIILVARETSSPIDDESFLYWFGDSKVVDADGDPLVVHKSYYPRDWRTDEPFEEMMRPTPFPAFNNGEDGVSLAGFFSSDPDVAKRFAYCPDCVTDAFFLRIERPYVIDAGGRPAGQMQFGEEGKPFRDAIRTGDYDGVFILGTKDEGDLYVPLSPEQIKSTSSAWWDRDDPRFNPQGPRGLLLEDGLPGD